MRSVLPRGVDWGESLGYYPPLPQRKDIIGRDVLAAGLVATNFLGSPTTTYATSDVGQSFEFGSQIDSLTISADRLTLTFLNETFNAQDDLRIITAKTATAVPEPSGLLLLGVVLIALIPSAKLGSRATRRG